MNITTEQYKLYKSKGLDAALSKRMDQYLLKNPIEKKALEGALALDSLGQLQISSERISSQIDDKPVSKSVETKLWYHNFKAISAIAASFLVIAFLFQTMSSQAKINVESYFEPYPDVISNIVRGDQQVNDHILTIEKAMTFYKQGEYQESLNLLNQADNAKTDADLVNMYKGICQFALEQYGSAEEVFIQLHEQKSNYMYEDGVEWFLALTWIAQDKTAQAKSILQSIADKKHYKRSEAKEILETLSQ